jgi:hypothetical protein
VPNNTEPLQTEEVVQALTQRQERTLVHTETGEEVNVYTDPYNQKSPWRISYSHREIPGEATLKHALALGFELSAHSCKDTTLYELGRNCFGIRAAAIKALRVARMLPSIPENAWLWVTTCQYDEREDPPPEQPTPWPPVSPQS